MQGISKLIAGDSLDFTTDVASYPASDGWTLKYRLVPRFESPAQAPITLTASTYETDRYRVQAGPSETADWATGAYGWASWVEQSGQRITLEQGGELTVAPDPAEAAQGTDVRSDAQIALANVRAVIRGVASKNVLRYTINGRSLEHYSIPDLLQLEAKLVNDVKAESNLAAMLAGQASRRKVFVRMGRV